MFSKSAEYYDRIYFEFKDYPSEAEKVRDVIARENPGAARILDVACGTAEHARILAEKFGFRVDGIDIEERFVELARKKNPGGDFFLADMADFDLGRAYDVVLCLFSSIGYLLTLDRVAAALRRFRSHAGPEAVILVEPWFPPESFVPGKVSLDTVEAEDMKIARMVRGEVEGRISTLHIEYLIGTKGQIEHETEIHRLGLFTVDEMKRCFSDAGLSVEYDAEGPSGRGLYVARRA